MAININPIKGKARAYGDKVLISNMHFGEQITKSGIVLRSDNGTSRGIYARWGQVYSKGPNNKEEFEVGDWILVEHGRWTRGFVVGDDEEKIELRMADPECILAFSKEKPEGIQIGNES
jgi:co-chaperonin GroES (HSP10)